MADKYEKYKHNIALCFDLAATQFTEELQEDINDCCDEILKCIDKLKEYEKIGTVEDCRKHKDGCIIANVTFDKNQMQEIVDEKIKEFEVDIQATRNKAIDEFASKCKEKVMQTQFSRLEWFEIDEIARELKGGV